MLLPNSRSLDTSTQWHFFAEPQSPKGPPSPNDDDLDKVLFDILNGDPNFPPFIDNLENMELGTDRNFEEDLAILNDIANRELHSERTSNFTWTYCHNKPLPVEFLSY